APLTMCAGKCVDVQNDPANCGACSSACPPGQVCSAGVCSLVCAGGTTKCGGACVDTKVDPQNCGGCGVACAKDQLCQAGSCALNCGPLTKCGNECVDTSTNASHCGGCNQACAKDQECTSGKCVSVLFKSCNEILKGGKSVGDGTYTIDPDGGDPSNGFKIYCDMSGDGGGWTLCFADKYQGKGSDQQSAFDYLYENWDKGSRVLTRGNTDAGSSWGNSCPVMAATNPPPAQIRAVSYGQNGTPYVGALCTFEASFFKATNQLVKLACSANTILCSFNKPVGFQSTFGLSYACNEYNEGQNQGSSLNFNIGAGADYQAQTMTYTNMHTNTCPVQGDRHCTGGWCYECAFNQPVFDSGIKKTLLLYVR
ncbi:MAG: hypothetical protein HY744_00545, partial [Deltaproteobacteria bacterium]|nr:hypothetical protein [Deltaproteobacteria bacterium]